MRRCCGCAAACCRLSALRDVLRLGRVSPAAERRASIAIVGFGMRRFGVIVDGVDDAEEIVVKSLAPMLRGVRLFAGTTILGDGTVVLILDPGGLAAAVGAAEAIEPAPAVAPPPKLGGTARGSSMLAVSRRRRALRRYRSRRCYGSRKSRRGQIEQIDGKPVMLYRGRPTTASFRRRSRCRRATS